MGRPLSAVYGFALLVVPERVLDAWEPMAYDEMGASDRRSTTVQIARLKGLFFVAYAISDDGSGTFRSLLGVFGLPAMLAPRQYLETGLQIGYTNASDISVRSWVVTLTRLLGAVYVFNALRRLAADGRDEPRKEPIPVDV